MDIRTSGPGDIKHIRVLHEKAFGPDEGKMVAQLSSNLLQDATAKPLLSLVAVEKEEVIGNVIFSTAYLEGHHEIDVRILAPLAVAEEHQHHGVGGKLIEYGITLLKEKAIDLIFTYGDPRYYNRFGFQAAESITAPYELSSPEGWLALELTPGMLQRYQSTLKCPSSLAAQEYW